jgi:PBP1b-binding outer membrane lipoprotein LpoB
MKKVFHIVAVILFTTIVLCSCSAQKCPAYSHSETEQSDHKS